MMNYFRLAVLLGCFLAFSCSFGNNSVLENISTNSPNTINSPANVSPSKTIETPSINNSTKNLFDFNNFAFPVCSEVIKETVPEMKTIKLNEGELEIKPGQFGSKEPYLKFTLVNVSYNDLTNDNSPEAIVTIGIKYAQGAANCTFIYSLSDKTPQLLFTHKFGDGPDNGLRRIAVEDNGLLIEQYTKGPARCCSTEYSRLLYIWDGGKFTLKKSETYPTETERSEFLGFPNSVN